jgi:hypothetical protein
VWDLSISETHKRNKADPSGCFGSEQVRFEPALVTRPRTLDQLERILHTSVAVSTKDERSLTRYADFTNTLFNP